MKSLFAFSLITLSIFSAFAAPAKTPVLPGPPGALIVDVRTQEEFASGHIPSAALFPYDELSVKAPNFAALVGEAKGGKDRPIVVYCRSGRRSAIAAKTLRGLGYRNVTDFGGIDRWKGPLER
ncbi:MAG: rhodanese-like domain-containing protein [Treponemataceae bacterium]